MEVILFVDVRDPIALPIAESSQVGDARRAATSLATRLSFSESRRSDVGIIVTELATNLVRHAKAGQLFLRSVSVGDSVGIEMLSLDTGPGISNVVQAVEDGFSTGSTPGNGLGAVKRLSSTFEVYSQANHGSVILSRVWQGAAPEPRAVASGVICLPKSGEEACGDAYHVAYDGSARVLILVADGLGHGLQAAEASRRAVMTFQENLSHDGPRIIAAIHAALRSTRGAAVALAEMRLQDREIRFTGVGNIAASVVSTEASRSMVSHNGTAGVEARRIQEFVYPWPLNSHLIMHSDGLKSQWQISKYAGLNCKDPSTIAGVLYRDHRRERDDATVLVAGEPKKTA